MFPDAPGRFSTTTGCFQRSASFAPIVRARRSGPVAVVYGTIVRTTRLG